MKPIQASSSDNDVKTLDDLRSKYKRINRGYRKDIYTLMGDAMSMVISLRKSKRRRDSLREKIGTTKKWGLTLAVLRYIVGVKGENSRTAEKWARAMDFLYDKENIEPADFPVEITRRGGIEKLAREAAKARRPPAKQEPANDNRPISVELQIEPQLKDTLKKMTKGSQLKLIVTKEAGKLVVKKVLSFVSKTAASA